MQNDSFFCGCQNVVLPSGHRLHELADILSATRAVSRELQLLIKSDAIISSLRELRVERQSVGQPSFSLLIRRMRSSRL